MRILLLDQFSELGGAQRMLLDLLPAIRERGWTALLIAPGDGPLCTGARSLGLEVATIDGERYRSGRKSAADFFRFVSGLARVSGQIREIAARFRPDAIYINGPRLLPAAALARLERPVLFHAHNEVPQKAARLLAGRALKQMEGRAIAVSHSVAEAWRPFAKIIVIYNGVGAPRADDRRPTPPGAGNAEETACATIPRIGCIGRISPEKGQREFLAAAARIHRVLGSAQFVICGAPLFSDEAAMAYERVVRQAAAGLPVEFTGWVPDVYRVLRGLDLLLVPSVWAEPNPRVVLEAFAAGVPVIAFRTGGLPEIIDHGRTGFLCVDAIEMADLAIKLLCDGGARLQGVADAACAHWRTNFTLERWQQQVLDQIERTAQLEPSRVAAAPVA